MIEKARRTSDGTFLNPPGSPRPGAPLPVILRFFSNRIGQRNRAIEIPPGHVLTRAQVETGLAEAQGRAHLCWLGHAAFLIHLDGKTFLTDPYLGKVAGPVGLGPKRFVPAALAVEDLPKLDAIVLSHNHYDHLCVDSLKRLAARQSDLPIFAPLGLTPILGSLGFTKIHEMDWGDQATLGAVTITALPCVHFSGRGALDRNKTLWCAFALKAPEAHVIFAGDSGYGQVFKQIGQTLGPVDAALIGIGAYEPEAMMRAVHTDPEEAVQVAIDLRARIAVAMHWGTIVLSDEPVFEPPARFRTAAQRAGIEAWVMAIGETRVLPQSFPGN